VRDSSNSFALAASATSCGHAPKWAIIVSCDDNVGISCVNDVGCVDDSHIDDGGKHKRKSRNRAYYSKKKLCLLDFEPNAAVTAATAIADATAVNAAVKATAVSTADSAAAVAANKQKSWDRAYYAKKKLHLIDFEPNAAAAAAAAAATATVDNATAVAAADSAAAVAAADHTSLSAACELARISLPKEQAAAQKFVCEQSARMMKRNRATQKKWRRTRRRHRSQSVLFLMRSSHPCPSSCTRASEVGAVGTTDEAATGYYLPAQPGLIRPSVRPSIRPSVRPSVRTCLQLQIRYSAENGTGPTDSVNYSLKS
jgi:hypothetical protein